MFSAPTVSTEYEKMIVEAFKKRGMLQLIENQKCAALKWTEYYVLFRQDIFTELLKSTLQVIAYAVGVLYQVENKGAPDTSEKSRMKFIVFDSEIAVLTLASTSQGLSQFQQ